MYRTRIIALCESLNVDGVGIVSMSFLTLHVIIHKQSLFFVCMFFPQICVEDFCLPANLP